MKSFLSLFLFQLLLCAPHAWSQQSMVVPAENFPPATSSLDFVRHLEPRTEGTLAYTKDIVYVTRDQQDLHLQLIAPRRGGGPQDKQEILPCIVYIQGSAWMKQNVYVNIPQLAKFAARGYIIAMVEYRPSSVAPFPAQIQDTKTAIRFLRMKAREYGIDPENIFLWGDSSGGHTAVFSGITSGIKAYDSEDYNAYSDHVNAIIDYYGPIDIVQMNYHPSVMNHSAPESPEGLLIGGLEVLENQDKAQETNPLHHITLEDSLPPILIAHGNMDLLVPFHQSELLAAKLHDCGQLFAYYCLKGAGHGSAEFWTSEMYDIVDQFISQYRK